MPWIGLSVEVPTALESWQMTRQIEREVPHLPVRGPGVPEGLQVASTTNWMSYRWSINNVVMAEVAHTALGFWEAGRAEEAWRRLRGALLASMFMGITPGNVGTMNSVMVNGAKAPWHVIESAVGAPQIEVLTAVVPRTEIAVQWSGDPIALRAPQPRGARPVRRSQGEMRWTEIDDPISPVARGGMAVDGLGRGPLPPAARFDPVDLSPQFNDTVTRIFQHEYRSPRSPHVSFAIPKQGIGGWAGGGERERGD